MAIIFRGTGKRISQDEKNAWHPDIDVYFQENAWADTKFSVEWVERTLKPNTKNENRFALFCDNLTVQITEDFKESVSNINGICWYGLPNATDLWQPVDAGYAQLLKVLITQDHHTWLDSEENAEKWYDSEEKFTAKERRILITHWAGEAYNKLSTSSYDNFRKRMWQKTGCLITADGSDDNLIQPEGIQNYEVPPPSLIASDISIPLSIDPEASSES